jgi:hypothetical protein
VCMRLRFFFLSCVSRSSHRHRHRHRHDVITVDIARLVLLPLSSMHKRLPPK